MQTNNNSNNITPLAFSNKMPSRNPTRIKVNSAKFERQIHTENS